MSGVAQMALPLYRNVTEGIVSVCPAGPSHQWVALQQAAALSCHWATDPLLQQVRGYGKGHLEGLPGHPMPGGHPVSSALPGAVGLNGLEGRTAQLSERGNKRGLLHLCVGRELT